MASGFAQSSKQHAWIEGFRNAYHDARGEGWTMNHKKIQRLWREEGYGCRHTAPPQTTRRLDRTERRRAEPGCGPSTSSSTLPPTRPVKIASIVDEHTR